MMANPQRPNDIFPNFYTENNICKHCGTIIQRNFRAHVLFHLAKTNSLKNEFLYERVPEMNICYFKCKICQSLFHFHYQKKRLLEHFSKCKLLAQNGMNREKNITELVKRHIKEVDELNQTHPTEKIGVEKKRKMLIELVKRHIKEVEEFHEERERVMERERERERERKSKRKRERESEREKESERDRERNEEKRREKEWEQESNKERRDWRKSPRDRSKERDRSNRRSSRESERGNEKYATKGKDRR